MLKYTVTAPLAAALLASGILRTWSAPVETPVTFPIEQAMQATYNPDVEGGGNSLPQTMTDALIQAFQETLQKNAIPGGAILASIKDDAFIGSFGVQDLGAEPQEPFRLDNHFRIGSNTKPFTASAILDLVQKRQLSLDDFYTGQFPNADQITIRNLLDMTSGVFAYSADTEFYTSVFMDPSRGLTFEQTMDIVRKHEPYFARGDTQYMNYSNTNFAMLGHVIEITTGKSWDSYVNEVVIQNLGLGNTSYPSGLELPSPASRGYYPLPGASPPTAVIDTTEINPETAGAAGGLVSNLKDLQKWGAALAKGFPLTPDMRSERFEKNLQPFPPVQVVPGLNQSYGLGCMKFNNFIGHTGNVQGFSSYLMSDPDKDITLVAVFANGVAGRDYVPLATLLNILDPAGVPLEAPAVSSAGPAPTSSSAA